MTKDELIELQEILDNNEKIRKKNMNQRLVIEFIILTVYVIVISLTLQKWLT